MRDDLLDFFIIKDKKILNLLDKTLAFSFAICLLGILLLHIFLENFISFRLYEASIIVFRTGLFIGVTSVMSSLIINRYNG